MKRFLPALLLAFTLPLPAEPPPSQTEQDEYTQYELLAPDTASLKITYEVMATNCQRYRVLQSYPQRKRAHRRSGLT